MLDPYCDRLDYGQILAPDGYSLDFAVGTTYSLDLDSLVSICLSLGLSQETDSEVMSDPIYLLEALRKTGDKIALFCEDGQIHMPRKYSSLCILLEKIVYSVKTKKQKDGFYPSFHPKLWLIRYKNNTDENIKLYRVIVLSRNLTFDRSWDVVYYLDGSKSSMKSVKNQPLCDFLIYLQNIAKLRSHERAEDIGSLAEELHHVEFKLADDGFKDFEFIPSGIGSYSYKNNLDLVSNNDNYKEIFIMSPFISKTTIHNLNQKSETGVLITRKMSLGKLQRDDVSNLEVYTMRDEVLNGEMEIENSDSSDNIMKQDVHAKIFLTCTEKRYSYLYLGSMNASENALSKNIEFIIRLTAKNSYVNVKLMKESLFGSSDDNSDNHSPNPFMKVDNIDEYNDEQDCDNNKDLERIIKEISRSNPKANVDKNSDSFSVTINFEKNLDLRNSDVEINPLLSPNQKFKYADKITFTGLTLVQLSEFYVIKVSSENETLERVIMIQTKGIPADGSREKQVVSNTIKNSDGFYRYISFLLGDDDLISRLDSNSSSDNSNCAAGNCSHIKIPALYEKMLQTAANSPDKLKEIGKLMDLLSERNIDISDLSKFRKLYKTFMEAIK